MWVSWSHSGVAPAADAAPPRLGWLVGDSRRLLAKEDLPRDSDAMTTLQPGDDAREGVDVSLEGLGDLFETLRPRLRRMVQFRLDPRLRGRVDPSDVLQEALVDAVARLGDFPRDGSMPLRLWVRLLTGQRLIEIHRRHLGAAMRDAGREATAHGQPFPEASSIAMANALVGREPSPSGLAIQRERARALAEALDRMKAMDREVLVLRHFEQATNNEVAEILGLTKAGASLRYLRAAKRLKESLSTLDDSSAEGNR